MMIVDIVTGFMQAYRTLRKSTDEAIKCLGSWASIWGMPYEVKSDFGRAFIQTWEEELDKLGVRVLHSSAYNSQSMGLVERSVRTHKDILRKNNNITQLQLQEHIYAGNCKEEGETGSATTRFMGRGTRTGLLNSWERFVDWQDQIKKRGEQKEKQV